ncbi:MAG: hypothetical protein NVSMB27_46420 [Ktedonobacteraceae bacterium]
MNALTHLNTIVSLLQHNAARVGITAAGLLVSVYCIGIMLNTDTSPAARTERWGQLKKVFLCAGIIAGTGAFVQFATGLGGML